jgi:3-oxoadipate enol-lactonase/4-carboxymuconolactone decarboxylase
MNLLGWVDDPGSVRGGEALILVPSLGTTARIFDDLRHDVARRRPTLAVVRVDLPGHGIAPPAAEVSIEALAGEIADVIDRMAARSVRVAGVSLGGAVAFEVARRGPRTLHGFGMFNSGLRFGTPHEWDRLIAAVEAGGPAALRAESAAGWFSEAVAGSEAGARILDDLAGIDPGTYVACCRALAGYRGHAGVHDIRVPALLVGTTDDRATPASGLRGLSRVLPAADYYELPDGGHLSLVEHGVAVGLVVAHWLQRSLHR